MQAEARRQRGAERHGAEEAKEVQCRQQNVEEDKARMTEVCEAGSLLPPPPPVLPSAHADAEAGVQRRDAGAQEARAEVQEEVVA